MSAAVAPGPGLVNTHEADSVSYTYATLDDRDQERGVRKKQEGEIRVNKQV